MKKVYIIEVESEKNWADPEDFLQAIDDFNRANRDVLKARIMEKLHVTNIDFKDPNDSTVRQSTILISQEPLPDEEELTEELEKYLDREDPERDLWDYDMLAEYLHEHYGESALEERYSVDWREVRL